MTSISNIKKDALSALEDIKAFDIVSIDIRKQASIADYIIIASASSSRQAKALAENVRDKMQKINIPLIGIEGKSGSEWVYTPVWLPQLPMSIGTTLLAIALWDNLYRLLINGKTSIKREAVE